MLTFFFLISFNGPVSVAFNVVVCLFVLYFFSIGRYTAICVNFDCSVNWLKLFGRSFKMAKPHREINFDVSTHRKKQARRKFFFSSYRHIDRTKLVWNQLNVAFFQWSVGDFFFSFDCTSMRGRKWYNDLFIVKNRPEKGPNGQKSGWTRLLCGQIKSHILSMNYISIRIQCNAHKHQM